jgi:hypothetical protein
MAMGKTEKINGYNRNDEQELLLNIAVEYFELDRCQLEKFIATIEDILPDWDDAIQTDIEREYLKHQIIKENQAMVDKAEKEGIPIPLGNGKTITLTSKKEVLEHLTKTGKIWRKFINQSGNKSNECANMHKAGIVTQAFCYINTHCNEVLSKNDKYYFAGIILALFSQLKPPDNFNHEGYVSNDSYRMYLHKRAERCIKSIKDTRITDDDIGRLPTGVLRHIGAKLYKARITNELYYYPGLDKKTFNRILPNGTNSALFDLSVFNENIVRTTITELWGNH